MKKSLKNKGFTLIEILVVVAIIAILAAIVIVAVNPAKRFSDANKAQRQANVNQILNAIGLNVTDNKGVFSDAAGTAACPAIAGAVGAHQPIPSSAGPAINIGTNTGAGAAGLINLGPCLVNYFAKVPVDPVDGTDGDTKYSIKKSATGYTVSSVNDPLIVVTN